MSAAQSTAAPPRLGQLHVEVMESLNQHRLLSTVQIHFLHAPETTPRFVQQFLLGRLRSIGLVDWARAPHGLRVWHLTEKGVDAVEAMSSRSETRRKVISPEQAAGPLQRHTLAVSNVGIAFVAAARERGDECGPFDWRHEIAHPLGPAPGRRLPEQLISDAVLTYQLTEPDKSTSLIYRFVELDRATRSAATLAANLGRYARLYRRTIPADNPADPAVALWTRLYPAFPPVLVALTGRRRDLLEERRETVLDLCRQDPDLRDSPEVEVSVCLLDDLTDHGPFAAIFRTVDDPDTPVDWLGDNGTAS